MRDAEQAMARGVGFACLAVIVVQGFAGGLDHAILRRLVQTAPLWIGVVFGFRGAASARPVGLALCLCWLAVSAGLPFAPPDLRDSLGDSFSELDIPAGLSAVAAFAGLVAAALMGGRFRPASGAVLAVIVLCLQAGAFAVALQPAIAGNTSIVVD